MLYISGRQHEQHIEVCKCESEAVTFVRYGLWPSTPQKPKVGFTFNLMLTIRSLVLIAKVPLATACSAMQSSRESLPGVPETIWVSIYCSILPQCF